MASYGHHAAPHSSSRHSQQGAYGVPMAAPGVVAPAGTFSPGTKIQVGSHRIVIQKYLSEGGFAHVYLVKLSSPVDGTDHAVLKRVAVPDKEALRGMRVEVETMKRLKGHKPIVTYIDSHASELRGGGYEVFLLMEFCNGGGLIDFMNTRLQHRLTEPEILNIFTDIAEGVACMHYLKPPLLHRDLKVENVLINSSGHHKRFKLCDFGSASPPRPAPTTVVECRLMDEDVQKHTTLQYRSPEMIDVYRKQPMNEKSDIWALGVLLYKLCYYTTPFEDQGQLAILNASYRFPSHPVFSDRLKLLIASMLKESMEARPNIYQVLREGCAMQGRAVPIHDIYSGRSQIQQDPSQPVSSKSRTAEPAPVVGAVFSRSAPQKQAIPEVTPMRRGRPAASPAPAAVKQTPPPTKTDGDPFAALDSKASRGADADELSSRFPTLDQFSLLHDQGNKFDFDASSPSPGQTAPSELNQLITERLVDEVFATQGQATTQKSRPQSVTPVGHPAAIASPPIEPLAKVASAPNNTDISRAQSIISNNPELRAISTHSTQKYVSTGTMTSTPPPQERPSKENYGGQGDASEIVRSATASQANRTSGQWNLAEPRPLLKTRMSSYQPPAAHVRQPSSSRPSLEGGRPQPELLEPGNRTSLPSRPRPASTNFESNTLDFLREKEAAARPPSRTAQPTPLHPQQIPSPLLNQFEDDEPQPRTSTSELDFLRSMEESDRKKTSKRSSLTALSGNKNILSTKFGDAFKRFEGSNSPVNQGGSRTPSPAKDAGRRELTPIAGSEATDGRSDDGQVHDDEDHMTPEMRRELERQKLEEEEQRVATAQAEYRKRVAEGGNGPGARPIVPPKSIGGVSRVTSIQNRVQNLLNEDKSSSNIQRTAQGYGRYTDTPESPTKTEKPLPGVPRKPLAVTKSRPDLAAQAQAQAQGQPVASNGSTGSSSAPPALASKPAPKPPAPKKPTHLNSLNTGSRPVTPAKTSQEMLVGMDLPGQPVLDMTAQEKDDYIQDFAKRYPSLGQIEMVEREIEGGPGR